MHIHIEHGTLYDREVIRVVELLERRYQIKLYFGSWQRLEEPGYNFGGDSAFFSFIPQEWTEELVALLVEQGIPRESIEVRA